MKRGITVTGRIRVVGVALLMAILAWALTGSGGFAAWWQRGERAAAATRYQWAIRCYFAAAGWSPRQAAPYARLGHIYSRQARAEQAYAALWQAHVRDPGAESVLLALGQWCLDQGLPAQAADWFTQAMLQSPDEAAIRYALAQARIAQGDQVAAIHALGWAVELDPTHWSAHYALGMLWAPQDAIQARYHLDRALADPALLAEAQAMHATIREVETLGDEVDAAAIYGLAYLRVEWWALAEEQLRWASWRLPDNVAVQAYLGYALYQRQANAQAIEQLRRATALAGGETPDGPAALAHQFLALAYHRAGWLREAILSLEQAQRLSQDDPAIATEIAQIYAEAGQYDWAAAWFSQAVSASNGAVDYVLLQAAFHIQRGYEPQEGRRAAELALTLRPGDAYARCLLGRAHYLQGAWDEAERMLRKAVELDPALDLAHFYLGDLYGMQEKHAAARHHYQRVIDLTRSPAIRERAWELLEMLERGHR